MATLNTLQKKEDAPTTTVKGKVARVTGTQGGLISLAQQGAKASRLKGVDAPAKAGKYAGNQTIKVMPKEDGEGGNPHRVGTYRYKAFEAMSKCKTAGEYAASGFKAKYLERWAKQGLIRLV